MSPRILRDEKDNGYQCVMLADADEDYVKYEISRIYQLKKVNEHMPSSRHIYQGQEDKTFSFYKNAHTGII